MAVESYQWLLKLLVPAVSIHTSAATADFLWELALNKYLPYLLPLRFPT